MMNIMGMRKTPKIVAMDVPKTTVMPMGIEVKIFIIRIKVAAIENHLSNFHGGVVRQKFIKFVHVVIGGFLKAPIIGVHVLKQVSKVVPD